MDSFVYEGLPARVIFGHGTLDRVADEAARVGQRVLVEIGRAHV